MRSHDQLRCPACRSEGVWTEDITIDVPYFGEAILSTFICTACGLKGTDVFPLKVQKPARYTFRLLSAEGLDARVVRSRSSSVRIPELGVSIDPGSALDGYVTNVEGLLRRIIDVLRMVERDLAKANDNDSSGSQEKLARSRDLVKALERCIEGRMGHGESVTIVLEDPLGNSLISDERGEVQKEELSDEEIEALSLGP